MRDHEAPLEDARFALAAESAARTEAIGEAWGRAMRGGETLLLTGDLGAGKTTLVRGLARGLGVAFGVKSPTFAILLSYPGRLTLHHVDLYRLADARDVEELGLDDLFDLETVTVVEWGERLGALAPAGAVRVTFGDAGPEARIIEVRGPRATVARLAEAAGASIEEAS